MATHPTSLKDKLVFITGASSGIGRASAMAFAAEGARLLLCARRIERLRELETELEKSNSSTNVHSVQLDVRNRREVEKTLEALPEAWKAIDILLNNAGLSRGLDTLQEGSFEDWDEMIDTNVKGLL